MRVATHPSGFLSDAFANCAALLNQVWHRRPDIIAGVPVKKTHVKLIT